eukprot:jgi/Mesen1/8727/ME000052S08149
MDFEERPSPLPLRSLNHISRTCKSLHRSLDFYADVLGFIEVKRPDACLDFDGAWLFNYGIGVHLLKSVDQSARKPKDINPRNDHLSFQCDSLAHVEAALEAHGIKYVKQQVFEGGIVVNQIFFHDPDDNMIEICNCEALPVVPLCKRARCRTWSQMEQQQEQLQERDSARERQLAASAVVAVAAADASMEEDEEPQQEVVDAADVAVAGMRAVQQQPHAQPQPQVQAQAMERSPSVGSSVAPATSTWQQEGVGRPSAAVPRVASAPPSTPAEKELKLPGRGAGGAQQTFLKPPLPSPRSSHALSLQQQQQPQQQRPDTASCSI